jgi:hypothetical protein
MNSCSKNSEYKQQEEAYINIMAEKLTKLSLNLSDKSSISKTESPLEWYGQLNQIKQIIGNLNNDVSFIATLLAKNYLKSKFKIDFDAAEKKQGAPGLDIDIQANGKRIIGEIKTTTPYGQNDFGSQQKTSFKRDFEKLRLAKADYKYMFVTEDSSYSILCKESYSTLLSGVTIVQLTSPVSANIT